MNTPLIDHYYMPAEWHPHQCCWMGWPCRPNSWPFELSRAAISYANVAQAIARYEPVNMVTLPEHQTIAQQLCGPNIQIVPLPLDDTWLRDTGPTFLIHQHHSKIAGIHWQFNAWGENRESLADYQQDALLGQRLLQHLQLLCYQAPLILEGGSFYVDGQGTLLTTEECLLNPNRNPHLTQTEIENYLRDYLNISKIIWLGQGLENDETAGHVDNLACFVHPGTVLALTCQDPQDSNYPALQDNLQRLRHATDAQGRSLEIIEIPQPAPREDAYGRLALSYINFYRANGGLIVPTFDDPADQTALNILSKAFSTLQLTPVYGLDLVYGGGCIHCITQQQPVPLI